MKNQQESTHIEVLIMFVVFLLAASIPLYNLKNNKNTKQEVRNHEINYNDYKRKCIKGQTYLVSKEGNIRQILTEHKDPILCEIQNEPTNNIEVNANPYKLQ